MHVVILMCLNTIFEYVCVVISNVEYCSCCRKKFTCFDDELSVAVECVLACVCACNRVGQLSMEEWAVAKSRHLLVKMNNSLYVQCVCASR